MKPLFVPYPFLYLPSAFALAIAMTTVPATAHADMWEKIVSGRRHTVEINASAIFDAEHGTKVSWERIVLNDTEAKQAGYRTIKALSRYDCLGRSFTTIKRVYLRNDDSIFREEVVSEQQPMPVRSNSLDEQIWRRVCGLSAASVDGKPGSRGKTAPNAMRRISKLADAADQAAQNASIPSPPKAMLLPAASVTVGAAPQKTSTTPAATDSPPATAPAKPVPSAAIPTPPIQLNPIPMPSVPQNPATPRNPKQPVAPQSQKRFPDASSSPRRVAAAQPFPASAASAQNVAPAQQPVLFPGSAEDWGYFGAIGPEFWGKLRPEWNLCAEGKRQSPIDFMAAKPVTVDLDPVKFDYRPASFVVINGPRQLRVRVTGGMGMEVRGQRYALEGFTLHRPAETQIDNRIADMEAHFFHRDDKGRIAVLAVQFVRGGQSSVPLQILLNNLPLEKGDSYAPQTMLDMAAFLPPDMAHYLYMGSLTTPPCTEGILWVVMKEPMIFSDGQYEIFSRLHAGNARPPQPAFDRLILESR